MPNEERTGKSRKMREVSASNSLSDREAVHDEATEQWLDDFTERMMRPGQEEEEFFARRRQRGLGAGLDENGKLVKSKSR